MTSITTLQVTDAQLDFLTAAIAIADSIIKRDASMEKLATLLLISGVVQGKFEQQDVIDLGHDIKAVWKAKKLAESQSR